MRGPDILTGAAIVGSMPEAPPRAFADANARRRAVLALQADLHNERNQGPNWAREPRMACAVEYAVQILDIGQTAADPEDVANLRRLEALTGAPVEVVRAAFTTALAQLDAEVRP